MVQTADGRSDSSNRNEEEWSQGRRRRRESKGRQAGNALARTTHLGIKSGMNANSALFTSGIGRDSLLSDNNGNHIGIKKVLKNNSTVPIPNVKRVSLFGWARARQCTKMSGIKFWCEREGKRGTHLVKTMHLSPSLPRSLLLASYTIH